MNKEMFYKLAFYIFISTLIFYVLIILSSFLSFLPFSFLTGGDCESYKICGGIDASPVLLSLFLINLVSGILLVFLKRMGKKLITVFIIFIIFALFNITVLNGERCKSYNAERKSDLAQIKTAQEIYYGNQGRFANNFDELIADKDLTSPLKDPKSQKIYSDADGTGLDGGDENPATWSVRAYIDKPTYNYCVKTSKGHWFVCNQSGCYDEIK